MEDTSSDHDSTVSTTTPLSGSTGANTHGSGGMGGWSPSEPVPLQRLLGIDSASIPSREPVVFCVAADVSEEYLGIVETVGRRLYRERVGGTPTPIRLTDLDELRNETRWVEAEGGVTTIALSADDWERLETDHTVEWKRLWENRIQNQLYSQEFGVIILNQRVLTPPGDHFPRILQVAPDVPTGKQQDRLARLAAGFGTAPNTASDPNSSPTFAQRFNYWQEAGQRAAWQTVESAAGGLYWDATARDEGESRLHRRLKTFAVRAIADSLPEEWSEDRSYRELQAAVETERTLQTGSNENKSKGGNESENETIRADVYCDGVGSSLSTGDTVAVEAETLFASDRAGGAARDTLRSTLAKYEDVRGVDTVILLVDPLSVLTHGHTLASVATATATQEIDPTIRFATVDFETEKLLSLRSLWAAWTGDTVDIGANSEPQRLDGSPSTNDGDRYGDGVDCLFVDERRQP